LDTDAASPASPSFVVHIGEAALDALREMADAPDRAPREESMMEKNLKIFERYAHRLDSQMLNYLTRDDKALLGQAYQLAEEKNYGLEKMDKLARKLGIYRYQQFMEGYLVLSAVGAKDDDILHVDLAHMEILGEMKKMAG
jgi:hypothetical protein